jgi:hypothetical protein
VTSGLGKALTSTTRSGFYTDFSTPYHTTKSPPVNNKASSRSHQHSSIHLLPTNTLHPHPTCAKSYVPSPRHTLCFHACPLSLLPRVKAAQQHFREVLLTTVFTAPQVHLQTGQCVSRPIPRFLTCLLTLPRVTKLVLPSGSFTWPQQYSSRLEHRLTARLCRQTISGEHGLDGSGV